MTNDSDKRAAEATEIQFVSPSNDSNFFMYSQVKIQAKCDDTRVKAVVWSFVNNYFGGYETPNLMYVIEPLRSTRSEKNGLFEATLTYFGRNPQDYYTNSLHALADDPSLGIPPASVDLSFYRASAPSGNILALDLRAAYTIAIDGSVHPLLASFTDYSGRLAQDPNWDKTITWSVEFSGSPPPGATVQLLATDPTKVDDSGLAANGVRVVSSEPAYIKVTATATGTNPAVSRQATIFCTSASLPGQGSMVVTSDDQQPLTLEDLHSIRSTYTAGYGGLDSRTMEWRQFPSDRLSFSKGPWALIAGDGPGVSINSVEAEGTDPVPNAMIFTSGFNDQTRVYDWGVLYPLQFGEEAQHGIEISGTDPIPMYKREPLTATNQNTSDLMNSIYWWGVASDEGYQFVFSQNPTKVTGNLKSSVDLTIYGPSPESGTTVTIYAQSDNANVPIGQQDFGLQAETAPAENVLTIDSLDNDPLSENTWHLLQATYQSADGRTKLGGQTVTWSLQSGTSPGVTLGKPTTTTLDDGTTLNSIEYVPPENAGDGVPTAKVQASAGPAQDPDVGTLTVQFTAKTDPIPGLGSMVLDSTDDNVLTEGDAHKLTCTYTDSAGVAMLDFTPVTWNGIPDDRLTFSGASNQLEGDPANVSRVTGGKGQAHIYVTGSTMGSDFTALISTTGEFNAEVGAYDHSDTPLTPKFYNKSGNIVIDPPANQPLTLYQSSPISATYTVQGKGVENALIEWRSVPDGMVAFDPNPAQADGSGKATTSLTGYGPNQAGSMDIIAYTYDADTKESVSDKISVAFATGDLSGHDQDGRLVIESLEGDVLWGMMWHVLRASYVDFEGKPIPGEREVDWNVLPPAAGPVVLHAPTTKTDATGVAMNMVHAPGPYENGVLAATIQARATNPDTNDTDEGELSLTLTLANTAVASRVMQIDVGTLPLENDYPWPLTVTYTEADLTTPMVNAPVDWGVYPYSGAELSFGDPSPTRTGTAGKTSNTISYAGTDEVVGAVLVASSFNEGTGQTDFVRTSVDFAYADPVTGIMINRPWAQNPDDDIDPTVPCEVVTGKVKLAKSLGDGQIGLTAPADPPIGVYDMNGKEITPVNGMYHLQAQNSVAEFKVGAGSSCFVDLNAYYPVTASTPVCTTNLTLSSLGGLYASSRYPLQMNGQPIPSTLPMPDTSTWPNPTFQVSIPAGTPFNPNAQVQILLNYRVAYAGTVGDITAPNAAEIAYALLQPTDNRISYLVASGVTAQQVGFQKFAATGTPQTGPSTGSAKPWFPPPAIISNGKHLNSSIGAADIVNGLRPMIFPISTQDGNWLYQAGDEITVYYYLSGQYPMPTYSGCPSLPDPVYNVCAVKHPPLTNSEDLTGGDPQLLEPLAQRFLAGYGRISPSQPGTLRANFKVRRGDSTYWSQATTSISLDTATLDPSS